MNQSYYFQFNVYEILWFFMKKTLIVLAVTASVMTSGSAMAWTPNGSGGSVELGGTLTPAEKVTLWEVKTGDTVTNLDAQIQKGQQNVDIVVKKAIPVLGIRNADENGFAGIASGNIIPQITYENNAVDVNSFSNGITTLTLDVHNESGDKIGIMTTLFSAAAYSSWDDGNNTGSVQLMSSATGAYFGGLGKTTNAVRSSVESAYNLIKSLNDEYTAKTPLGKILAGNISDNEYFVDEADMFKSAYGAGIEAGKTISIALDTPAEGSSSVKWKASLPITVTYQ